MKTLGQRIREIREEKDISLRELAKKIDVSAPFLSDVELGRRYPSDKVLLNLAHALGTSIEELRKHDSRAPVEDLRRLANADPRYGLAFRKVIDKKISAQDLINFAEEKSKRRNKQ